MKRRLYEIEATPFNHMVLEETFVNLHRELSAEPRKAEFWWGVLENLYSGRPYHNLRHIEDGLVEFASVGVVPGGDKDLLLYAWMNHDSLQGEDAEARSGLLAQTMLAYPSQELMSYVVATEHKYDVEGDMALMCDVDLSILGEDLGKFARFEKAIREEYSHYTDEEFVQGRTQVLQGFLGRERIYKTDEFHDRYEEKARDNLKWVLHQLKMT